MATRNGGRYVARIAGTDRDVARAQALRWLAFVGNRGLAPGAAAGTDADAFDPLCRHVLIETADCGTLVGCFRLLPFADGAAIGQGYAARHYDLRRLAAYPGPMAEVGRFCLHPDWKDPAILRLAWAELARQVAADGVAMLFGCTSFPGTDAQARRAALAWLAAHHLGPRRWRPGVKAAEVVPLAPVRAAPPPDPRAALRQMPALLRSYLAMGGWVSDHAVVDRALCTLHVFTAVEIAAIPAARARALRGPDWPAPGAGPGPRRIDGPGAAG